MIPVNDLVRAAGVALLALALAMPVRRAMAASRGARPWLLLLAPLVTPSLLPGYAYANTALALVHHPVCNWLWYAALLALKLMPVAALVLYFAPRPLSSSAEHCQVLAQGRVTWRFRWQAGCSRAPVTALALVFLLAFNEFELGSLMNVRTWSVRLFDGHAGGLPLMQSLAWVALPGAVELLVLAGVLVLLTRQSGAYTGGDARAERRCVYGWGVLWTANVLVGLLPALVVLHGTWQGWRMLVADFALGREIGTSLLVGAVAALTAYAVAPRRWWLGVTVSLPGLLGPLVLAIVTGALVQTVGGRETLFPWVAVLVGLSLPAAVLLRQVLRRTAAAASTHAARLLGGRRGRSLVWELDTRRHAAAVCLLFCGTYFELTASAILAPIGMTPVTVRLYNLMHYGQTAVLSAMVLAAFLAPLAVALMLFGARRIGVRA